DSDQDVIEACHKHFKVQRHTVNKRIHYHLETINQQIDRAAALLEQGRNQECAAVLTDVEGRLVAPNEDTLGFVFRSFAQHASHEYHQKLASIDAIIRDLNLPTVKLAH